MITGSRKVALIATATATFAAAIALSVPAQAEGSEYLFQSPSGNIACDFTNQGGGSAHLTCAIEDFSYQPPNNPDTGQPCTENSNWFNMQQGMAPMILCDSHGTITTPLLHRAGLWTLGYGQTLSAGAITCKSEESGMTCTDNSTGHFFRASRESYDIG